MTERPRTILLKICSEEKLEVEAEKRDSDLTQGDRLFVPMVVTSRRTRSADVKDEGVVYELAADGDAIAGTDKILVRVRTDRHPKH